MAGQKDHILPGTYGLIACGGQSNRMGSDKSMLQYYAKPQRYHVYDMLLPFCEKVFISCSPQQAISIETGYDFMPDDDAYSGIGPMGALLTAFSRCPDKHILLIGCDYPFLTADELEVFSKLCTGIPASFYNNEAAIYESMIAWYPCTCFDELKHMFEAKQFSMQQLLRKTSALKYTPANKNSIISVDTKEAYEETFKLIKAG